MAVNKELYFFDRKRKIDFILAIDKNLLEDNEKNNILKKFLQIINNNGLQYEFDPGSVGNLHSCYKIHAPEHVLKTFGETFQMRYVKESHFYNNDIILKRFFGTILTVKDENSEEYPRAQRTLSLEQPVELTTSERTIIVHKILSNIKVDDFRGYQDLIKNDIIKAAYPLHDSDYTWPDEGPLSDRQLLGKYWSNLKCFYKAQPLNLIESYFGSEIAFYFAWMGYFTIMLIPASILSLLCFLTSFIFLQSDYVEKHICNSSIILCPHCKDCDFMYLKHSCQLMKVNEFLENGSTVFNSILMTFWTVIFLVLWQRKQAMLRLVWNLSRIKEYEKLRMENLEYEIRSKYKKYAIRCLVHLIIILMVFLYFGSIYLVILFRLFFQEYINENAKELHLMESIVSASVTVTIIIGFQYINKIMAFQLTKWEKPLGDDHFDKLYRNRIFILMVANAFAPVLYLAFLKGKFYTYPGDTGATFWEAIKSDQCRPSGCMVDLTIQLLWILIFANLRRHIFKFLYMLAILSTKKIKHGVENPTRWEKDFYLIQSNRNTIIDEYIEMVIYYGMIIFFVAALPIGPLILLVNNVIEIRTDAMKFTRRYRRIIPKKVTGLQEVNRLIHMMTFFAILSNPIVIAFTSDMMVRYVYYGMKGSMDRSGFIDFKLSEFKVSDYAFSDKMSSVISVCYYFGFRHPPSDPAKYTLKSIYWELLSARCSFFIIIEHICLILFVILKHVIPSYPRRVRLHLAEEELEYNRLVRSGNK